MLMACLKTPDCNPKLLVKKQKDSIYSDYVVTLNGKQPFIHNTDLKLIKSLKLEFERMIMKNKKLTIIFNSIVGYEDED